MSYDYGINNEFDELNEFMNQMQQDYDTNGLDVLKNLANSTTKYEFIKELVSGENRYNYRKYIRNLIHDVYVSDLKSTQQTDDDMVNQWSDLVEYKRPIIIVDGNNIVDGNHKFNAYKIKGIQKVPVVDIHQLGDLYDKLIQTDSNNHNLTESIGNKPTDLILYRGEVKLIDKFNVTDNIASSLGKGIYMTDSIELAKAYSSKYLYKCLVKLNNPLVFNWRTDEGRDKSIELGKLIGIDVVPGNWIKGNGNENTTKMKQAGFDSIIVIQPSTDNYPEHLEVVIFNTDNIKILDVKDIDKFEHFLNNLKHNQNDMLIESIKQGYKLLFK